MSTFHRRKYLIELSFNENYTQKSQEFLRGRITSHLLLRSKLHGYPSANLPTHGGRAWPTSLLDRQASIGSRYLVPQRVYLPTENMLSGRCYDRNSLIYSIHKPDIKIAR